MSRHLLDRLQSALNTAFRLVFLSRKSDHFNSLHCELHWLPVPERIWFQLCVLAYHCLNRTEPSYLAVSLRQATDVGAGHCLQYADVSKLFVLPTRQTTLGDSAFPVAASRAWNSWPPSVRCAMTISGIRQKLKTFLSTRVSANSTTSVKSLAYRTKCTSRHSAD